MIQVALTFLMSIGLLALGALFLIWLTLVSVAIAIIATLRWLLRTPIPLMFLMIAVAVSLSLVLFWVLP